MNSGLKSLDDLFDYPKDEPSDKEQADNPSKRAAPDSAKLFAMGDYLEWDFQRTPAFLLVQEYGKPPLAGTSSNGRNSIDRRYDHS